MKKWILAAVVAVTVPTAALACEGMEQHHAALEPKKVTVTEVATLTKAKKVTPVDANGQKTRSEKGVIPGALLLTSSGSYDVKELPADKASKLVFYCANEKCSASTQAAKKALEAGYTDVAVMPQGISGWKEAGQPTSKPNS